MSWIIYSLLAVSTFSFVNIFDKFFIGKKLKSPYSFVLILNIFYLIFYLGYFLLFKSTFVINPLIVWSILSGLLYFFMWIFWFKALSGGEASRVTAVFFSQPVFTSILAVIFLGEVVSPLKWMATALIVIGAILSSRETGKIKSSFNMAYFYAILAALFSAVGGVVSKYATVHTPTLTVSAIGYFFTFPLYFIFLKSPSIFKEVRSFFSEGRLMITMFFRSGLSYAAICFFMLALGSGDVSLVAALNSNQPLFTLVLTTLTSVFFPKILKEEISKKVLIYKAISVILIVTGAIIISL
ncbi:MAG: Conserved hypothetical membrane protein, DUF6 family [Candidatus Roizmanbacteria bacterium GW2011_GWA2_35_8]|uniref:Conserved hypothetical membrane protein, DUF6 family n=1 Tax=Candidatus Roizmanbacteria bacterium GW2011_GWA2_35_8 TaxID=1618479 RepID=A0A0G0CW34_9BACT|nr:MAG: Conserved hypothetical membrane protein, DUF6 family [Candidatus Roizmanbacteria bacterium GW2011_GWA2_35_8]